MYFFKFPRILYVYKKEIMFLFVRFVKCINEQCLLPVYVAHTRSSCSCARVLLGLQIVCHVVLVSLIIIAKTSFINICWMIYPLNLSMLLELHCVSLFNLTYLAKLLDTHTDHLCKSLFDFGETILFHICQIHRIQEAYFPSVKPKTSLCHNFLHPLICLK